MLRLLWGSSLEGLADIAPARHRPRTHPFLSLVPVLTFLLGDY